MSAAASIPQKLYGRSFYLLLAALFSYMCGFSLLVHLAKFITRLGGDLTTASWIFGLGMIGALITRPFVGKWIDRIGCKPVLLSATVGAAVVILCLQWSTSVTVIGVLRVLLQMSQAALLATVAVVTSRIAPAERTAESLASVGIGGLVGIMVGPMIGDAIFHAFANPDDAFAWFFGTGAGLMCLSTVLIAIGPSTSIDQQTGVDPAGFFRLVCRHWPGPVVIIGLCLALAQTVPLMFIERFAVDRGLSGVTFFFVAYSPTAVSLRVLLRRLPARIGRRRTLIFGMMCYTVGVALLTGVQTDSDLLVPALIAGVGHCFSYPFLVDLAAEHWPAEHRGVATSTILGVIDIGFLLGYIAVGQLASYAGFDVTLWVLSATVGTGTMIYAWTQRGLFARIALRSMVDG